MRVGYVLMGVGLAPVKWPTLPEVHALPLYEGVTWCLLLARQPRSRAGGTVAWQPEAGHVTPSRHFDRGEQPSGWRR